ncbi:MAG: TonB C-terminal domain-containing protein [Cyanobacteria bacterium SZAS-4]|nr:TonB C-terminal domain-containing protein [Cyanobacteria bacterium SZAS-4]
MLDATLPKTCALAITMCLTFSVAAEATEPQSESQNTPEKHSSTEHKSKKKKNEPEPFDLKKTRYWKLLGMSKSAVIKELTGDDEESNPMDLTVYQDYFSGVRNVQDMRDRVTIVFKDDKAAMIDESFTYFTNYRNYQTGWYNSDGLIEPQPDVKEPTEPYTLYIKDGMDVDAYDAEIKKAILKNFHSAAQCNDLEISFEIRPTGKTEYVSKNETTSGNPALDKEAMDAISATTFPPLTGSHKWRSMALTLKLKLFLAEKPPSKPQ